MKVKVFGLGAAGNKGAIRCLEMGIIDPRNASLVNSTEKDIPESYREISTIIGHVKGAGKESKLGAAMMQQSLEEGELIEFLPEFLEEDDKAVIIIASAEGGTGCGSMPVLGQFIKEQTGIPVHLFILMGFQSDARGLSNTINLFKQIDPEYTVHTISNAKFLGEARGNKIKAEQMANDLLVSQIEAITGNILREGSQNIDDTDHFKLMCNPGYTLIESAVIDRNIKTTEQLNQLLTDTIRTTKSIDLETPACRRLGVIWNVNSELENVIDYTYGAIKDIVGVPYESFEHIQAPIDGVQTVTIVIAGLKLPEKEIQDIYDKYIEINSRVDKSQDGFYSSIGELETDDDEFNVVQTERKAAFFNKKKPATRTQNQIAATTEEPKGILRQVSKKEVNL